MTEPAQPEQDPLEIWNKILNTEDASKELRLLLSGDEKNRWTFRGIQISHDEIEAEGIEQWYHNEIVRQGETADDEWNAPLPVCERMFDLYHALRSAPYKMGREEVTNLALEDSLCPIHFVDYAICFDDANTECNQVREIHPNHDT